MYVCMYVCTYVCMYLLSTVCMYACKYLTLFESSRLHFQLYPKKRPLQEHPLTLPPSRLAAWQPLQLPKLDTHACPRGSVCKEFHLTAMHACIHK